MAVATHAACVCNEWRALKLRHHKLGPKPEPGVPRVLYRTMCKVFGKPRRLEPLTTEEALARFKGRRGKLYAAAAERLAERSLTVRDARVRMFLKDDKYALDKINNPPRAIQYRSKEFCLEFSKYVVPLESVVYRAKDQFGVRYVAKGRNLDERALDLRSKFDAFLDPYVILSDACTYDASYSLDIREPVQRYYKACYAYDRKLRWLCDRQKHNVGSSRNGLRYKVAGTNMSGEMDTALSTTMSHSAMLMEYLECCGVQGTFYLDGDDAVLILSAPPLVAFQDYLVKFGFNNKTSVVREFEHIQFCQTRPVQVLGNWRMVRDLNRVLVRTAWVVRRVGNVRRHLRSVALGEMACNVGVPVLQSYAERLCDLTKGAKTYAESEYHPGMLMRTYGRTTPLVIDHGTRCSFEMAYGVSIREQLALEEACARVELGDHCADLAEFGFYGI